MAFVRACRGDLRRREGKEHILGIAKAMVNNGQKTILITRLSEEAAEFVKRELPLNYNSMAHVGIIGEMPEVSGKGRILVATGGTSDIPVAEEAALTAEALGNDVLRLYDVGCPASIDCCHIWTL